MFLDHGRCVTPPCLPSPLPGALPPGAPTPPRPPDPPPACRRGPRAPPAARWRPSGRAGGEVEHVIAADEAVPVLVLELAVDARQVAPEVRPCRARPRGPRQPPAGGGRGLR